MRCVRSVRWILVSAKTTSRARFGPISTRGPAGDRQKKGRVDVDAAGHRSLVARQTWLLLRVPRFVTFVNQGHRTCDLRSANRLMGILGPIVQALFLAIRQTDLGSRCAIRTQFVGSEYVGRKALFLEGACIVCWLRPCRAVVARAGREPPSSSSTARHSQNCRTRFSGQTS